MTVQLPLHPAEGAERSEQPAAKPAVQSVAPPAESRVLQPVLQAAEHTTEKLAAQSVVQPAVQPDSQSLLLQSTEARAERAYNGGRAEVLVDIFEASPRSTQSLRLEELVPTIGDRSPLTLERALERQAADPLPRAVALLGDPSPVRTVTERPASRASPAAANPSVARASALLGSPVAKPRSLRPARPDISALPPAMQAAIDNVEATGWEKTTWQSGFTYRRNSKGPFSASSTKVL